MLEGMVVHLRHRHRRHRYHHHPHDLGGVRLEERGVHSVGQKNRQEGHRHVVLLEKKVHGQSGHLSRREIHLCRLRRRDGELFLRCVRLPKVPP